MEKFIYYLSTSECKKIASVVILVDGESMARGVSVCSEKDQFCRKKGRTIAEGRAFKALSYKTTSYNDKQTNKLFQRRGLPIGACYKYVYNPLLSEYEKTHIEGRHKG